MQPAAHVADRGVDQLELLRATEPRAEHLDHRVRPFPFHGTWRQHRPEANPVPEGCPHPCIVAAGEGLNEDAPNRPASHLAVLLSDE